MKPSRSLVLILVALLPLSTFAQSNGFRLGLHTITPYYSIPNKESGGSELNFGLQLGYRHYLEKSAHFSIEGGIFFDLYGLDITLPSVTLKDNRTDHRSLSALNGFAGLSFMPSWTFNPQAKWTIAAAVNMRYGGYWGWGTVLGTDNMGTERNYGNQSASAGPGFACSPRLILERDIGEKSLQLFAGWDSSDLGQGISQLRSTYYSPKDIEFHSSALIFGVGFVF